MDDSDNQVGSAGASVAEDVSNLVAEVVDEPVAPRVSVTRPQ